MKCVLVKLQCVTMWLNHAKMVQISIFDFYICSIKKKKLKYDALLNEAKTRRLVARSALILFLCRSGRRKEKKMEVVRKTTAVRRRNVWWTRRLCSGRISKSERRSALTHCCICFRALFTAANWQYRSSLRAFVFILRSSYCVFSSTVGWKQLVQWLKRLHARFSVWQHQLFLTVHGQR